MTRCLTALAVVTALVVVSAAPAQAQLGTTEEDVYGISAEVDASVTVSDDPRRVSTPADGGVDGAFISVDSAAGPDDPTYNASVAASGKEGAPGTSPGHRPKPWGGEAPSTGAPVIVVHGFEADARKDCNDFKGLADDLRSQGHPTVVRIRYYDGDRNCDADISQHWKSGHPHSGPGHRYGSHTQDASIPHLAMHLAWYVAGRFGTTQPVDLVAHSMGGVIVRYALYRIAVGDPAFPPLRVQDVVTVGTPHLGTNTAAYCVARWGFAQCRQTVPASTLLKELERQGQNPQAPGGTDWTLIGSEHDNLVSEGSATGMDSPHKVLYADGMDHHEFFRDTNPALDADVRWDAGWDGNGYFGWENGAPHVIGWIHRATSTRGW